MRCRSTSTSTETAVIYSSIFERLLELGLVDVNDLVILTKGELSGVSGGTNSMQILRVISRLSARPDARQRATRLQYRRGSVSARLCLPHGRRAASAKHAPIGSTVGLVLPGGGARAAYQVGVLKAIARDAARLATIHSRSSSVPRPAPSRRPWSRPRRFAGSARSRRSSTCGPISTSRRCSWSMRRA